MIFFAHAGHDNETPHPTSGTTVSDGSDLGLIAAVGAVLIFVIVVCAIYLFKRRNTKV